MARSALIIAGILAATAPSGFAQAGGPGPVGMEVRGDTGELMGRVTGVMRDQTGRIVGVEMAGLEPAPAPRPARRARQPRRRDLVAENESRRTPGAPGERRETRRE